MLFYARLGRGCRALLGARLRLGGNGPRLRGSRPSFGLRSGALLDTRLRSRLLLRTGLRSHRASFRLRRRAGLRLRSWPLFNTGLGRRMRLRSDRPSLRLWSWALFHMRLRGGALFRDGLRTGLRNRAG